MKITLYALVLMLGLLAGARPALAQCTANAGPDQVLDCLNPSVTLSGSSNAPNATFAWSGPGGFISTAATVMVSIPGTYVLNITDPSDGCTATDTTIVTQDPSFLSVTVMASPAFCFGVATGGIDLTVSGGFPPYFYNWSNGATTQDPGGLVAGTYTVTITDMGACTKTASATVTQPSGLVLSTVVTNAFCFGGSNGSIDLTVTGGTPPYTYIWSNNATTQDMTGIAPGTYTVTVTDANACTKSTSATISQPPALVISASVLNVICNGGNTGSINLTVSGGTPGYTYLWSNGSTTKNLNNLIAGTYTVTVTDQNGCTKTNSATATQPPALVAFSTMTNVACFGGSTGTIDLTISGGTPPYTYSWMNGVTTQDLNNLVAGVYTVTVTDANGCTKTNSTTVTQPASLNLTFTVTNVLCFGGADGTINLSVSGGTTPYTYIWANGVNTQDLNGLTSAVYTVTVTDANNCMATTSTTITQPPAIALSTTTSDLPCGGSIDLTVTGGTPAYTYDWSDDGPQSPDNDPEDLSGLAAGAYVVTVTDANGCSATTFAALTQPAIVLTITTTTINSVSCFGGSDGAIVIAVSGGLPPYTYDWSNDGPEDPDNDTKDLSGLPAGTYTITVTDANGCTKAQTATVNQNSDIVISALMTPATCFGGADGAITLSVSGGVPPYNYHWSNGFSFLNPTNLAAGTYNVTVTDSNGCTKTSAATVTEPAALNFLSPIFCDGNVTVQAYGGMTPYSYSWNTAANGPTISVPPGTYTVTVTDPNNCTFTTEVYVSPNPPPCTKITGTLKLDANADCLPDANETGIGNWVVQASGTDIYYGLTDANGQYVMPVAPGSYVVSLVPPANNPFTVCQSSIAVDVPAAGDTAVADFVLQDLPQCPTMTVDLSTPMLRRCFSSNYYIHYCNNSPVAATDAYLTLLFDQYLNILSADLPYTFIGGNTYRFNLGTVAPYFCGDFKVKVFVSCSSTPGQTHCTEAHIYPDTLCVPPNAQWSGAELTVQSRCENDSLHFVLKNIGDADMIDNLKYIVIEDGVMGLQLMSAPLVSGDSMVVSVPANGSTWRLEATQEPFFPGQSAPVLSVEGCPATSSFSTGFLSQFPVNDADPWLDVDCTVNTGSNDPNDKQGFPIGYGTAHYIKAGTEIEYMIRFQNTGTDTAFHVVVLDTLSGLLDPASIQLGAGSHPYQFSFQGPEGILVFDFQGIMLPDSNVNEPESHGFVKFRIAPRAGIPTETDILNNAAIYFDFNDPVFTNTTTHRIGKDFVLVNEWHPQVPDYQVQIMPNPVRSAAIIKIIGAPPNGEYTLHLYNLTGTLIKTLQSNAPQFHLQDEGIAAGAYLFLINRNGAPAGWGKIIFRD